MPAHGQNLAFVTHDEQVNRVEVPPAHGMGPSQAEVDRFAHADGRILGSERSGAHRDELEEIIVEDGAAANPVHDHCVG